MPPPRHGKHSKFPYFRYFLSFIRVYLLNLLVDSSSFSSNDGSDEDTDGSEASSSESISGRSLTPVRSEGKQAGGSSTSSGSESGEESTGYQEKNISITTRVEVTRSPVSPLSPVRLPPEVTSCDIIDDPPLYIPKKIRKFRAPYPFPTPVNEDKGGLAPSFYHELDCSRKK